VRPLNSHSWRMLSFLDWGSSFRSKKVSSKDQNDNAGWPPSFPQSQLTLLLGTAPARERLRSLLLKRQQLQLAIRLPESESVDDWIVLHCIDFLNLLNLLYGMVYVHACTPNTCPRMTAGPAYEFLWQRSDKRTMERLPASKYIELVLSWAEEELRRLMAGSANRKSCHKLAQRFHRIFAHLYHHHLADLLDMDAIAHLNTSYLHFYFFIKEFDLVGSKELEPMRALTECLLA
jgi:hypothetical protein